MKQTVNYKSAGKFYLIANLFDKGLSFITVPIFTRILSVYDYGIVTTYNSWISILAIIMGFAMHTGIRIAYVDHHDDFNAYTSTTLSFTILNSVAFSTIVLSCALLLHVNVRMILILLCLLEGFSTAVIMDYSYYLMMLYRYKARTLLMVLPNLISTVISVVTILFIVKTDLYMGRIVPTTIVNIIVALIVLCLTFRKSPPQLNRRYLKYGLTFSAPLIFHGIALNILSQSDRTMITWLADARQTGIYSLIYNFSMIAMVITSTLEGIWVPWFFNKMKQRKNAEINKLAVDYINLMTCAMVCLILVAPEIIKILADEKYWEGIVIAPPVVLSSYIIFCYTLYVNIEHYHKKTPKITLNTALAAIVNLVTNYLFIPLYGYIAAAYTTLFAYLLSFVMHAYSAKKLEPNLYPIKTFLQPLLHILITIIAFYLLIDHWLLRWSLMVIYLLLMFKRYHDRIFEFFPGLKQTWEKVVRLKK